MLVFVVRYDLNESLCDAFFRIFTAVDLDIGDLLKQLVQLFDLEPPR